jgi:predicted PurR-regulated permease PerM
MTTDSRDLARIVLSVLFIVGLMAASLWIIRPFLPSLIWATMIVVATWPVMRSVQQVCWGRRWLAVTIMTLLLLLLFVLPFLWAIGALVSNTLDVAEWAKALEGINLQPPQWLAQLPLVGEMLDAKWREIAALGLDDLGKKLVPHSQEIVRWTLAKMGSVTVVALQLLLIVVLSAILFSKGEIAAMGLRHFGWRLAGENGDQAVVLAGRAIRGVMLGVVLTAVIQATLGGIGLAIAGVPFAAMLTFVMFILSVAQIGVVPVMLCAVFWLYSKDVNGTATILLVWTVFVGSIDNIIRPILIKKGADLPLLLVFAGVAGGLLAFGLIGLFVGPILLAVSYTLLDAWIKLESYDAAHAKKSTE